MAKAKQLEEAGTELHPHRVEVRSYCPDCGAEFDRRMFDPGELNEAQASDGVELPERESMSLMRPKATPRTNAALKVLSDGSMAYTNAERYAPTTDPDH